MVSKAFGNLMSSGKRGRRPGSDEQQGSFLSEQAGEFKPLSRGFDLIQKYPGEEGNMVTDRENPTRVHTPCPSNYALENLS